jgi:nucleotide-binding universal stress UspA family protein
MSAHSFEAGMVIDGFTLVERLHRGGMATLWEVVKPGLDGPMLMKIPQLVNNDDPAAIVGFEVEQMLMPRLSGIHVPRFIAAGDFSTQPYIVMEHLAGESLRPRLDLAPIPYDEVASIGAKVAAALHDLHRQHVIHLDIKPSNIMFRPTGEAVLIDFGLSRHDRLPDLLAEEFRLPMGTGPYISPEQVLGVRSDPRSDLFALGVMLYHFGTGERPFGFPTSIPGLRRRLKQAPVPPRAIRPDFPPWLQEIVLRCLEVDPENRHASAAQVAFDLSHPDQVALTERAGQAEREGRLDSMKRWFKAIGAEPMMRHNVAEQLERAPFIMAAVDLSPGSESLADKVRATARRILAIEPGARLACVTVQKTARIGLDSITDAEGRNIHVKHLVALKAWARPLDLPAERMTFHVLEAPDAASAIVEYARANEVDHVLIGARGSGTMRRYLGSVSSEVVARAPCSVTVIRADRRGIAEDAAV